MASLSFHKQLDSVPESERNEFFSQDCHPSCIQLVYASKWLVELHLLSLDDKSRVASLDLHLEHHARIDIRVCCGDLNGMQLAMKRGSNIDIDIFEFWPFHIHLIQNHLVSHEWHDIPNCYHAETLPPMIDDVKIITGKEESQKKGGDKQKVKPIQMAKLLHQVNPNSTTLSSFHLPFCSFLP